ncbi:hypothetical protein TcBrA4_0043200 [Trypanosoma cruzi]|nr:hypothetical protein TcBrA4_0043200 [Trypanosoma cruzi]
MRASPESFLTSWTHTIIGNRRRTRLSFPSTVWSRGRERWKQSGVSPIMKLGRTLLQEFRMQLTMASEPDIPVFNIRARHRSAVNEADTFARAIPIPLERRGTQILSRCQLCGVYGHEASANNVRDATGGSDSQRGRPSRIGEGLLAASYESGRRQLHSFHHLPPFGKDVAPHRRHSIRYYKWLNAMVEKGNGAYLLTTLECGTTKHFDPFDLPQNTQFDICGGTPQC